MKNVPDTLLRRLRAARGDLPEPGISRWGKRVFLHDGTTGEGEKARPSMTVIATDAQPIITPMLVSLRFSLDGKTFTPEVPAAFGGTVRVELVEMIDVKTGAFREQFTLAPEERQPFCGVVCLALQVAVTIIGENVALWVQALAAPTTNLDCADIVGPPTPTTITPQPITDGVAARYPALTAPTTLILPNPDRGYFVITNQSAANLYVRLGDGVSITPGDELATIVLPPGVFGGYEGPPGYTGAISFKFDADDATGYALLTEGLY